MDKPEVKAIILQELPAILQTDPEVRELILALIRTQAADKAQTESRFEQLLDELRRDREEQSRKWAEQARRWEETREEQNRKWAEQAQRWEETREEQNRKWAEQARRWEENQAVIKNLMRRIDSGIGALGARWGIQAESSFRNGLKAILEESFGVEVINVTEYDAKGEVFGQPDQVELDVIIKDGQLILCEIKSSMSRSDMYTFDKKVRFYERLQGRTADRRLVISPMVEERAKQVAQRLGIEVYSYADDVSF